MNASPSLQDLHVGSRVVILRRGKPWRENIVTERREQSVVVDSGQEYAWPGGHRLDDSTKDRLIEWREDAADYLWLKAFRERIQSFSVEHRTAEELRALVNAAKRFEELLG
jgi:hypothetical protein